MLRKLQPKDAVYMLEWMHDESITKNFEADFASFTEEKVKNFIESSFTDENQHFAVVDEKDEYQGTISLKNISSRDRNAEYAVSFRKSAQGTGLARLATEELLQYAFTELNLERVYLNVLESNLRARRFYEKAGFKQEGVFYKHKFINGQFQNLYWYGILKEQRNK